MYELIILPRKKRHVTFFPGNFFFRKCPKKSERKRILVTALIFLTNSQTVTPRSSLKLIDPDNSFLVWQIIVPGSVRRGDEMLTLKGPSNSTINTEFESTQQ